jgi:pimeloyl-ACP methyl ester carboxylesterase
MGAMRGRSGYNHSFKSNQGVLLKMMIFQRVGLLLTLAGAAIAAEPPGIPDGWWDGYVYANGIRIHYYHGVPAPGKPVMVMAHGATDIGLCWTTLTQDLQRSYDIYMTDARGHGLTDPPTAADAADAQVLDLVGFVHAMKFDKPILMGHSMGAATVMRIGAQYPDLARAIIMLDPGLGRPGERGPGAAPAAAAPGRGAQAAPGALVMMGTPEALVAQNNRSFEDLLAKCRKDSPKWDIVDCQYWALSKKQYHGTYTPRQGQGMRGGMGTEELLSKITAPVLILKADAPPEIRKSNEEAAKVIQHGKLVHIDGAAHNLHHDQRQRTVDELNRFLKTL